eukprot:TRINITY_DN51833_c0_g1_i1.p1 TRINITY_DN51833_c0_g1~~TRINITY_DN51833_c0_g1_i1.p1  ORF type:complete len:239 (+),score=54.38 TRINITY_DN51833_c0_g1_i1:162-878(+)
MCIRDSPESDGLPEMSISVVLFDMAGTTVDDIVDGDPLVALAMRLAFERQRRAPPSSEAINAVRGLEKQEALRRLMGHPSESELDAVYQEFQTALDESLPLIDKELPGATQAFRRLKEAGISVYAGSGFPQHVVDTIVRNLNWTELLNGAFSSKTLGAGRPDPVMVHAAMAAAGVQDARSVLKVGDTVADVEEGKRAGCWTAALTTGTQSPESLKEASPDLIFGSLDELVEAILGRAE